MYEELQRVQSYGTTNYTLCFATFSLPFWLVKVPAVLWFKSHDVRISVLCVPV